jgi:hypothetical protein
VCTATFCWQERFGRTPQLGGTRSGIHRQLQIEQAREHPRDICIDRSHWQIESKAGDGTGGVPADTGQTLDRCCVPGQSATKFRHHSLHRPVKITRTRIVAEPLPGAEHCILFGRRQRRKAGEERKPTFVVWDHRGHLRLL